MCLALCSQELTCWHQALRKKDVARTRERVSTPTSPMRERRTNQHHEHREQSTGALAPRKKMPARLSGSLWVSAAARASEGPNRRSPHSLSGDREVSNQILPMPREGSRQQLETYLARTAAPPPVAILSPAGMLRGEKGRTAGPLVQNAATATRCSSICIRVRGFSPSSEFVRVPRKAWCSSQATRRWRS